jgi:hypothetical protein
MTWTMHSSDTRVARGKGVGLRLTNRCPTISATELLSLSEFATLRPRVASKGCFPVKCWI